MSAGAAAPRPGFWIVPGVLLVLAAALLCGWSRARSGPRTALGAAIGLLCMGLWATAALPEIVTTFLFFALATLPSSRRHRWCSRALPRPAFWLVLSAWWSGRHLAHRTCARIAQALAGRCPAPIRPSSAAPWRSAMRSLCHAVQHGPHRAADADHARLVRSHRLAPAGRGAPASCWLWGSAPSCSPPPSCRRTCPTS